jgi:hypothetical protein
LNSETEHIMGWNSGVSPAGEFIWGVHTPRYRVKNLRQSDNVQPLGPLEGRPSQTNAANFPHGDVHVKNADRVYEIPNAFPFRGATYITKGWAEKKAMRPDLIILPEPQSASLMSTLEEALANWSPSRESLQQLITLLPESVQLAIATTSTDPRDLIPLAQISCEFEFENASERPTGIRYNGLSDAHVEPVIHRRDLFEALANNSHLPADYREIMVLRPGAQGKSEIIGEYGAPGSQPHVWEYLRCNSYIPWGHYAANMADDAVRYDAAKLTLADIRGMRHLYYQRSLVRMADLLQIAVPEGRHPLDVDRLESLRHKIYDMVQSKGKSLELPLNGTLWGWNYGFDYAPSRYRLHASHQQVHQQFALIPSRMASASGLAADMETVPVPYACGDLVTHFITSYRRQTGKSFFRCYLNALANNDRVDGRSDLPSDLTVFADDHVILFVPKGQTSQWELQLMPRTPLGNIVETDTHTRDSLDKGLLIAMRILVSMGARLVTTVEYAKRFDAGTADQHILYALLPKLPYSPGAFTEAQMRWICGHYPEDFARACRSRLPQILNEIEAEAPRR